MHPNEYIRGVTLRFLCRLNESKIIELLIPSILSNLEHHHPFVRCNAVLAVMSVYKLPQGEQLLDNAPEIVDTLLSSKQDPSNKRNAFAVDGAGVGVAADGGGVAGVVGVGTGVDACGGGGVVV
ncbi:Coatomer beta subunit COPB1 [Vigna unguiculata]|uniref:Coatomer beta subunit COPB1 n=1 Tax=Vigna unguiculata TaxID=3917 RepID=A0A4D6LUA9_VIGUN|nr:Coatomer beta subunit COPB1 [Vigna unguiculata]